MTFFARNTARETTTSPPTSVQACPVSPRPRMPACYKAVRGCMLSRQVRSQPMCTRAALTVLYFQIGRAQKSEKRTWPRSFGLLLEHTAPLHPPPPSLLTAHNVGRVHALPRRAYVLRPPRSPNALMRLKNTLEHSLEPRSIHVVRPDAIGEENILRYLDPFHVHNTM